MQPSENVRNEIVEIDKAVKDEAKKRDVIETTDWRHEAFIDYTALNGLVFDYEGSELNKEGQLTGVPMRKMGQQELADMLKVDTRTFRRWRLSIPNFWVKVNERRKQIAPQSRLAKVHETWYLKAAKGDFQHMQLWLANFDPDFRMPTEKVEHEIGNSWAALAARRLPDRPEPIEGEVVNADSRNI